MRSGIFAGLLLATVSTAAAFAQGGPIKLANVAELSGGGATVGNNWKIGNPPLALISSIARS